MSPIKPTPSNASVAGSGTDLVLNSIKGVRVIDFKWKGENHKIKGVRVIDFKWKGEKYRVNH